MSAKLSVLIVDENRTNLALLDMLVRKLPHCVTQLHTDPQALFADLGRLDYDLAVIACRMAPQGGIEIARRLKAEPRLKDKPILLAAEEADAGVRVQATQAGIADVLAKPINPVEFRARILSLARPQAVHVAPARPGWGENSIAHAGANAAEDEYLAILAAVAGHRDRETPLHNQRLGRYCAILAHNLGLPDDFCRTIRRAAPLHDIGKAGVGDALRKSSGFLTSEERKEVEEHTRIGHSMLRGARSNALRMAAEIALTHHERWDGAGYPQRLRGEQIPLAGRIAAVADVFDALTGVRAYKTAWSIANAFAYLHDNAGEQFDPACVAAFESGREEIAEVMRSMADPDDGTADAA